MLELQVKPEEKKYLQEKTRERIVFTRKELRLLFDMITLLQESSDFKNNPDELIELLYQVRHKACSCSGCKEMKYTSAYINRLLWRVFEAKDQASTVNQW